MNQLYKENRSSDNFKKRQVERELKAYVWGDSPDKRMRTKQDKKERKKGGGFKQHY